LLLGVVNAWAQKPLPAKPFERFDGCVLEPDEWTDGDSFRVRLPGGRLGTFRRSRNAVIRVFDVLGNVIETHEHKRDFKQWLSGAVPNRRHS
jgi:hypothetical protein